jgi:hypothetical protein
LIELESVKQNRAETNMKEKVKVKMMALLKMEN